MKNTRVDTGVGESVLLETRVGLNSESNNKSSNNNNNNLEEEFTSTTTQRKNYNLNPELEKYYSSYYNSEFGLIEAIKANWERDDSFNCALLDDPYAYQACMNLLKCKRFERRDGVSFLDFCPRTLAGGLFK